MANNRMYLVDEQSGDSIAIFKAFTVWYLWAEPTDLNAWLECHDYIGADGGVSGLRMLTEGDYYDWKNQHPKGVHTLKRSADTTRPIDAEPPKTGL